MESLFLLLLALFWFYFFVINPLKVLFDWLKEKYTERRFKHSFPAYPSSQKPHHEKPSERIIHQDNETKNDDKKPVLDIIEHGIDQDETNTISSLPQKDFNDIPESAKNTLNPIPKNVSLYQVTDSNVRYLIDKGVKWLYHFTSSENIESIIENGILSRSIQEASGIIGRHNDPNEAGSKYISVSIEWPNYKMFYKKRIDNPTETYVVVCISIIALTECQFKMYSTNSSKAFGASLVEEAHSLFYDSPSRMYLRHDKFPTDPQAELRILDQIPTKYIKAIYFESNNDLRSYCSTHQADQRFRVTSVLFSGREDYEAWR